MMSKSKSCIFFNKWNQSQ